MPAGVKVTPELAAELRARNDYADETEGAELLAKRPKKQSQEQDTARRGTLSSRQAKRLKKILEAKYGRENADVCHVPTLSFTSL